MRVPFLIALLKATCMAFRSSPPRVLMKEIEESLPIERASCFLEGTIKLVLDILDIRLAGKVDLFCFSVRLGVIIGRSSSLSSFSGRCFNLL